jgi:hypothetical protein
MPVQAAIDAAGLEEAWPKQRIQELEVGRHAVRWRHKASRAEGIFSGIRFTAPAPVETVWERAADYQGIGPTVPGVRRVRTADQGEGRQVVDIDAKVLWREFTMRFEVEQDPPNTMRFRLVRPAVGEFQGIARFRPAGSPEAPGTVIELSTWLRPTRAVPIRLLLAVERMAMLHGTKAFLGQFEPASR